MRTRIRIRIDDQHDLREMALYLYSLRIQVVGIDRQQHEVIADITWADAEVIEQAPGIIGYTRETASDLNR